MISLAGYQWKAGRSKQVAYVATDLHIHELYVLPGGDWIPADLTQITGGPQVASPLMVYEWDTGQSKQVIYITGDGHIHQLFIQLGGTWADADWTVLTPAPPVPFSQGLPPIISAYQWDVGRSQQVVYATDDGNIHEILFQVAGGWDPNWPRLTLQGQWTHADLTQNPVPLAPERIVGYEWNVGQTKQVAYLSADGHINELFVQLGENWTYGDLTKITGAPPAYPRMAGYEWDVGQSKQVVYMTADGHIHELAVQWGGRWAHADLTQITNAPLAAGWSDLAAYQWDAGQSKQVVYMTPDGHVHELAFPLGGKWAHADLTQITGAPSGLPASVLVGYGWTAGQTKQVAYATPDGHIHELYFPRGGSWNHVDLTWRTQSLPLLLP